MTKEIEEFVNNHFLWINGEKYKCSYDVLGLLEGIYELDKTLLETLEIIKLELEKGNAIITYTGLINLIKEKHNKAFLDYGSIILIKKLLKEVKSK